MAALGGVSYNGEPRVSLRAYHISAGSNFPIHRIVIHDAEFPEELTSAEQVAAYFTSPSSGGSAHYIEDENSEEHCVGESAIAWHAPPNVNSIGIEQPGYASYSAAQWNAPAAKAAMTRMAVRTADLCHRYGVPLTWLSPAQLLAGQRGITSHANVSAAWHQTDHTDPGPQFPVAEFMAMVQQALGSNMPTPPPVVHPSTYPKFPGRLLEIGVGGTDVLTYQTQMAHRGWKITCDGQYGPATATVTRSFQAEKHLGVDGIVGNQTWVAAFTLAIT